VRESFVGRPAEGFVLVNQRRYRFPMDVLKVNTEGRSCLVTHSLEVRRADRRAFGRVEINVPLEYRAEADSTAKHREGALCNLSARGAGITCADRFKKGDKLVLYLKPGDCVKDTTGLDEEVLEERTVTGTVVAGVSARAPVYHVEFQDISQAEQNNLSQLVRAVEREAPRSGLDQE
jgi:c-di-GMP-binding flagellar brake protein YcgR